MDYLTSRDATQHLTISGIVHCHTEVSYDSQVTLGDLCRTLRHDGFGFVALTEHSAGLTAKQYEAFVENCRRASTERFLVLPGLEIRCPKGPEIAAIGVSELIPSGSPDEVVDSIHRLGGYAIWVHPLRDPSWKRLWPHCDAVEVLNGKSDGTLAPSLSLLRRVGKHRRRGGNLHVVFGLDLHSLQEPRCVWVECRVSALTVRAVVESLRAGRFVSRAVKGGVAASVQVKPGDLCWMVLLRLAHLAWTRVLKWSPDTVRRRLIRCTRPLADRIKRNSPPAGETPPGPELTSTAKCKRQVRRTARWV